jgi:hypothetical protein
MNYPVFCALAAVCFATGWWVDVRFTGGEMLTVSRREKRHAAESAGESMGNAAAAGRDFPLRHATARTAPAGEARTLEEFLKLIDEDNHVATRARVERALNHMTAAEYAALARELIELTKTKKVEELGAYPYNFVNALLLHWLPVAPGPALNFALDFPNTLNSETVDPFLNAMEKFYKTDAAAAMDVMAKIKTDVYYDARIRCFESLKGMAPDAALKVIVDFDAKTGSEVLEADYLGHFPEQWIQKDPATAMNWALALPPSHTKRQMLAEMGGAWGKLDAAAATQFVDAVPRSVLPDGALRSGLLNSIQRGAKR